MEADRLKALHPSMLTTCPLLQLEEKGVLIMEEVKEDGAKGVLVKQYGEKGVLIKK